MSFFPQTPRHHQSNGIFFSIGPLGYSPYVREQMLQLEVSTLITCKGLNSWVVCAFSLVAHCVKSCPLLSSTEVHKRVSCKNASAEPCQPKTTLQRHSMAELHIMVTAIMCYWQKHTVQIYMHLYILMKIHIALWIPQALWKLALWIVLWKHRFIYLGGKLAHCVYP